MKKAFIKMHGLGNDFAVFDARQAPLNLTADQIRRLANRHTGIGFDQMVLIDPPKTAGTEAFMRLYNADGGEVGACGNATRCVGKLLMNELKKQLVKIETISAVIECVASGENVRVDMGTVYLNWEDIPLRHEENTLSLPVEAEILSAPVAVSVGNPHAVFFVEDVTAVPLEVLGPGIEHHPLFPERTNVEIAQVIDRKTIRMRVWERGAGITHACGTGACAAGVAGVRRGLTDRNVKVILDGGTLDIEWRESDNHVLMIGAAAEVFRGEIEI